MVENAQDPESDGYIAGFEGNSFIALSVTYMLAAAGDWFAPSIQALVGLKAAQVTAAMLYTLYVASFYTLSKQILYSAATLVGIASALMWVAQVRSQHMHYRVVLFVWHLWCVYTSANLQHAILEIRRYIMA